MTKHLPEDPSQFMGDMPSSDPLGVPVGDPVPPATPGGPVDIPVPEPTLGEPPVSPDDPVGEQNPFANLDDDEQNSFDEDEVLAMRHMTSDV